MAQNDKYKAEIWAFLVCQYILQQFYRRATKALIILHYTTGLEILYKISPLMRIKNILKCYLLVL